MPRLRVTIGARERMEPAVIKATPLGLLGTEHAFVSLTDLRDSLPGARHER
jgi:hypothetical protein